MIFKEINPTSQHLIRVYSISENISTKISKLFRKENSDSCTCTKILPNKRDYYYGKTGWYRVPNSHDMIYKCPYCNKQYILISEEQTYGTNSYESSLISIREISVQEIGLKIKNAHNSYLSHCRDYDPNRYFELTGSNQRYTEEEETEHINRVTQTIINMNL
ncbi:MAG: hypothetical protein WC979_00670 [Candidatus Pacearchaeota archaeon]|jgi:hypothetical protein|nr:hypothetical protein [Clostridia bacterium]